MAGKTRTSIALGGLLLASGSSLTQCGRDLGREVGQHLVPDRSYEAFRQEGFGPVTRSVVGTNDEGGSIIELTVTSTKPKAWGDAQPLMWSTDGCGDGRTFSPEWITPPLTNAASNEIDQAIAAPHPAGTRFVLRLSCEGPLPGETSFDAGLSETDALAIVEGRIGGVGIDDPDGVSNVVAPLNLGRQRLKYTVFNEFLGLQAKRAHRACNGPATLESVVVGELPMPSGEPSAWKTATLFVGVDFACASTTNVASSAEPPDLPSPP